MPRGRGSLVPHWILGMLGLAACGPIGSGVAAPAEGLSARGAVQTIVAQTAAAAAGMPEHRTNRADSLPMPSPWPTTEATPTVLVAELSTATLPLATSVVPTTAAPLLPLPTLRPTLVPLRALDTPTPVTTRSVVSAGNLRSSPELQPNNILAQVCVGDAVAVLGQNGEWYRIRVVAPAADCHPQRATAGTEGWLNATLLVPLPSP